MPLKLYYDAALLILLLNALAHSGSAQTAGRAESCEAQLQVESRMEVLPGTGWDNLRNMYMGLVFEYNYTQCKLTTDRKFLLPDGFFAIPVKESDVETYSELIDHWQNHTSLTSLSINAGANYESKIDGKFSYEHTKAKTTMHNDKSTLARIQVRHKLYIVRLQSGTKLHPIFKARLLDIAAHIMDNNDQIARYLSELLVRDYGTHYLTAAHAGAILVLEDYIDSDFVSQNSENKRKITASVSANFFGTIGFSAGFNQGVDDDFMDKYLSSRTYSHIRTFGGPPYRINFTINDWEDGLSNSLVAIDREGVPLHFAIIPEVLTELPPEQTLELAKYVEKAINSYYKHNTYYGCTDPNAKNFYFSANIDDGSCKAKSDDFKFGGVYQTCSHTPSTKRDVVCPDLVQKNPLTGDYTCPPGYEAVLLHNGTKSGSYVTSQCDEECHHFIIKYHCHKKCHNVNNNVIGNYQMYWCADKNGSNSGYMFGGLYSSVAVNSLTRARSCPSHYYPLRFGENTHICVSDDDELGGSVPFGGFESCSAGNILSTKSSSGELRMSFGKLEADPKNWPHKCPTGYTQYMASMEQSCEISYCVKAGSLDEEGLPPIKLPPYQKYLSYNPNMHNVLSVVSANGRLWEKDGDTNKWKMVMQA